MGNRQVLNKIIKMEELPPNWADKIKGKKIVIATPMHDGKCCSAYLKSMLGLWPLLKSLEVEYELLSLDGCSIIELARNEMANGFLWGDDAEYLMFIDSDMGFDPSYVPLMMYYDKDICTAPSPKKQINWKFLKKAIKAGCDDVHELEHHACRYILDGLEHDTVFSPYEMIKMTQAGTGFTMIKREVFEEMAKSKEDKNWYKKDPREPSKYVFFRVMLGHDNFIGEDIYFSQKAVKLGFEVWLCPWMEITHVGVHEFHGNLKVVSELGESGY